MSNGFWIVIAMIVIIPAWLWFEHWMVRKGWISQELLDSINAHRRYNFTGKQKDKRKWHELRDRYGKTDG